MYFALPTCKLTEIEVSNIVYCMVLAKFSRTTTYKNVGVPNFMEGSLISYKIGDSGPLFHIKMRTQGPRGPHFHLTLVRQSHSSPASLGWQGSWSERNARKRASGAPRTHFRACKISWGHTPTLPSHNPFAGPHFLYLPLAPQPSRGPSV